MYIEFGTDRKVIKVLMVSFAAPPKGSPESLQVSKYLKYLLNHPLSISLVTEKLPRTNFGWRTIEGKYQGVLDQLTQVLPVPVYYHRYVFAVIRRIRRVFLLGADDEFVFAIASNRVQKRLREKPDIIYSRSTPFSSAVLALALKKKYRVPWIMHLSDPWVISPFFDARGSGLKYHENLERACFQHADVVTLTSNQQIKLYKKRYPQFQSKFRRFPNVFDDDEVIREPSAFSTQMSFVHTGNFYGPGRTPQPLLAALDKISIEDSGVLENVSFLFTGYKDPLIGNMLNGHESVGVRHLGVLTLEKIYQLQRGASVLVIIDWQLPKEQSMFLLSKTLDYMAAGKPILAITTRGGTLHNLIQGVYGHCFEHHDINGIKNHLTDLIYKYRNHHKLFQAPYQVNEDYSANYQARRLFMLISETVEGDHKFEMG